MKASYKLSKNNVNKRQYVVNNEALCIFIEQNNCAYVKSKGILLLVLASSLGYKKQLKK